MATKRCIVHINIVGFAHAVAARVDPSLQDRPVVVAPQVNRSQIFALSPHAFSFGIRKGMALSHALRLCPDCIITPPKLDLYHRAMTALCHEVSPFSPFIEHGHSDGHIFADLSGTSRLFGPGVDVARRICKSVTTRLGLRPGWAIGPNKLVAKVASRVSRTQGECEVPRGQEAPFLAPHSLTLLPGTQQEELRYLDEFCLTSIGDTVKLSMEQLHVLLQQRAPFYHDSCRGIDPLPVGRQTQHQHLFSTFSFAEDTNDKQQLMAVISLLGFDLCCKLRQQNLVIRHLDMGICYTDTTTMVRKITLEKPTNNDLIITGNLQTSFNKVLKKRLRIRSLHLNAQRFYQAGQQLSLFSTSTNETLRNKKLMQALDRISARYDHSVINRARALQAKWPAH